MPECSSRSPSRLPPQPPSYSSRLSKPALQTTFRTAATVLAWNNSALFLGISLGSLVGGQAISQGGFAANLRIAAAIAIAGWMINQAVMPNPARSQAEAMDLR